MRITIARTDKEKKDAFSVRKAVFVEEQQISPEIERDEFEDEATHFVVYDNAIPIAAGRLRFFPSYGKVERVCVLPAYRQKGIGKKIMHDIEQFALSQGWQEIRLNAQASVEVFYQKLGYITVRGPMMIAGIPHVEMKKELDK